MKQRTTMITKKIYAAALLIVLLLPAALSLSRGLPGRGSGSVNHYLIGKSPLVDAWANVNMTIGDSGSPQVVVGKQGWLYYREGVDSALGLRRMTDSEVLSLARALRDVKDSLARSGTAFVFLVAPDKATIYPQHLPWYMRPAPHGVSNRERLLRYLDTFGVSAPDLAGTLRAWELPVYPPTDTHWTAYGAWLALKEALAAVGMSPPFALTINDFTRAAPFPGDLYAMLWPLGADPQADLVPDAVYEYRARRPMRSEDDLRIETRGAPDGPTLYAARDSFGRALFAPLAHLTSELTYVRNYGGFVNAAAGKDVAMMVIVERYLPSLLAQMMQPLAD